MPFIRNGQKRLRKEGTKTVKRILEFEIMTGKIVIDLEKCEECETKACIQACTANIFKRAGKKIELNMTRDAIKRGGCTETAACELECHLRGEGGLRLILPMPELDHIVEEMNKRGEKLIY